MEKYEKRLMRNKRRKRRNAVISVASLLILFSLGFFIGGKASHKKNVVVSAADAAQKDQQKKNADESMNNRERAVNSENKNDTAPFDPYKADGRKVAYLTFDDGPSPNNTPKILDILKNYNIKATFFVIGQSAEQNSELLRREASEGHVVANHTYSHNMKYIYSNPSIFVSDLEKCEKVIKSILSNDYNLKLVRFPGGSFGNRLAPFREAVKNAGYHNIDWNDLTGDAEHASVPVSSQLNELKKYTTEDHVVVLMHDAPAKATTVQALPEVIEYLKSQGYVFETLK